VSTAAIQPEQKKPYAPPTLVAYGTVCKLTQNGAGSVGDGGAVAMNMMCL
jgi:hypothetical protein